MTIAAKGKFIEHFLCVSWWRRFRALRRPVLLCQSIWLMGVFSCRNP